MTDSLTQRLWDRRVWKSRGPTWLRAIEWLLNIEILIQKWILDTIKNGWMILTLKYFVWLKKALSTDNQRSSPRRLSSNKMTNVNRFAIYLRSFHPRDLWSEGDQNLCQSSERFRGAHAAATVKQKQFWALSEQQWINWEKNISLEENIWAPKIFTFLAEGARQAGERVSLQSISVQEKGTSMVTSSR